MLCISMYINDSYNIPIRNTNIKYEGTKLSNDYPEKLIKLT